MDINKVINEIANNIENFNNKENKTWGEVYRNELSKLTELPSKDKEYILMKVVKEISRRGYSIEDNPFRLEKY